MAQADPPPDPETDGDAPPEPGHAAAVLGLGLTLGLLRLGFELHRSWGVATPAYLLLALVLTLGLGGALALLAWRPLLIAERLGGSGSRAAVAGALGLGAALGALLLFSPQGALIPEALTPPALWFVWRRGLYPRGPRGLRLAWGSVLALGAALRLAFVGALPWPRWSGDASSHVDAVHAFLAGQDLVLHPMRTPGQPLFVLAILGLSGSYLAVVVGGHALGLLGSWWCARRLRRSHGELAGWLLLVVLALHPKALFYEHVLRSEALFVLGFAVSCVLAVELLQGPSASLKRDLGRALAAGLALAAALLARPIALPAALLLPGAAWLAGWKRLRLSVLAAAIWLPLAAWCLHNQVQHGFFGLTNMSGLSLFGVAGHLLDLDSPGQRAIKDEMRPAFAVHAAAHPGDDPDIDWLMYHEEGPLRSSPTLQALPPRERERVVSGLAWQAVRQQPLGLVRRTWVQLAGYVLHKDRAGHVPRSWQEVAREDRLPEMLAESGQEGFLEGPLVSPLAQLPGEPIYRWGVRAPLRVVDGLPLAFLEQPLLIGVLLVLAWRGRRDRLLLLLLAALAASLVGITCVLNRPQSRYALQALPPLALAACAWLGPWLSSRGGDPQPAPLPRVPQS